MKKQSLNNAILKYLKHINTTDWILDEAYKFEFANFVQSNVNLKNQSDQTVLDILIKSQKIKYDKSKGIQFILKSAKETPSEFIGLYDIKLFRLFENLSFDEIDWSQKTMSYTGLTAWLASIFPDKIYPVPAKGFNETINYLFETDAKLFPKTGLNYVLQCQEFLYETEMELRKYPLIEIHLNVWNTFFKNNPNLNIIQKTTFEQVDWNWVTQDFHLFVFRKILNLYKLKTEDVITPEIVETFEPIAIEGQGVLATHMRYERDSNFIKKIKQNEIKSNPMLNCEVCGFSFFEKYGKLGKGFIEAHHKQPLYQTKETKTTRDDIALVCSNCHRMIQRGMALLNQNSVISIDDIKASIIK